ncbi:MAG: NTP/NDP exchange transporter [Chlamydiales bacterium]|nr:NTP/NDP exchange transporter [Chlamydiales bacterium]
MAQTQTKEFGKWRSFLFPVHSFELKKLLPMLFLFFLIIFNYTILRDTKDTLIVTASGSGAEAIPFLKVYGVLPFAILFMVVYAKLSNKLSKTALFYSTIIPFIAFFALFATVIYPMRDFLHPHAFCDMLQEKLPSGFMGVVAMIRNWSYSLFYIMAELWGSVALSLLFWGFANDTTRVTEAKRFYSLFGLGGNFSMLLAGPAIIFVSNMRKGLGEGVDPWQVSLNYLMAMVVGAGVLILATYWYINRHVLTDPRFYDASEVKKKKDKPKMSIGESFKYLLKSKYIGCIAILVIAYGISINLVEVTWKSQLKLQYPNPNEYSAFMGMYSTITGAMTILMMLFVGGNLIRRKGWTFGAMTTPVILLATGALFFTFIIFRDQLGGVVSAFGTTPLMLAVVFGMAQNIASKSTKYSLFDPTKEMAYIPLDQEQKVKGKAAVDVVGARAGKSGGALIQQVLIIGFGSIAAITPYIALILFGIIAAWMLGAKALGKQFGALQAQKDAELETASKELETAKAKTQELAETAAKTT